MADCIQIYPNKLKKESYENERDAFLQDHANREKQREMEEDKKLWEFKDDTTQNNPKGDFKDQMKSANDRIEDINRRRASLNQKVDINRPISSTDRLGDNEENENHKARHFEMNLDPQYWQ